MRRWTETTKWGDRWFRRLVPSSKLFYLYLLDECDEAGVWEEDFELFSVMTGIDHCREVFIEDLGDRILVLPDDKILVRKFLPYQQPKGLRAHVPLHQKIQTRLELHGLRYEEGIVSVEGDTRGGSPRHSPRPRSRGLVTVTVPVAVKRGKKNRESEGKEETLPASLDCPEFRKAWKDFVAYRIEINRKLTDLARTRTLNRLEKVEVEVAVAAIYTTIENTWTGVDPKFLERNGSRQGSKEKNRDYAHGLDY